MIYSYRSRFETLRAKELRILLLYVKLVRVPAGAGVSTEAHDRKPIGEYDLSFIDDGNPTK